MDMGVQATHISNQTLIYALRPEARNRINTIYMVTYFIGGSIGTFLSAQAWKYFHWSGVCITCIFLSLIAILFHLANQKAIHKIRQGV
jgi:predicted MFS family arabinose efflux permease